MPSVESYSWAEICQRHPNEWVCLHDVETGPHGDILSGRVISMRSETSFDVNGDLIVVDAVVVGPTDRAAIQVVVKPRRLARGSQTLEVELDYGHVE
jgi:hypothetical protein